MPNMLHTLTDLLPFAAIICALAAAIITGAIIAEARDR
jgi:hypothetical protein